MYRIRGADGKDYGPVTADQVRQWIAERRANAQSLIHVEGTAEWNPLSTFPEFTASLGPPSPAPSQPPSVPQYVYPSAATPSTNPMAITSMVLGILSLPCCGVVGAIFGVMALIFGGVALSQIKKTPALQTGKGLALTGIILGSIGLIIGIGFAIFAFTVGFEEIFKEILEKAGQG